MGEANGHDPLEGNDPVWALLGRSPLPEPDGWFASRTLARCRHAGLGATGSLGSFHQIWRWAVGSGLTVCLAVFFLGERVHPQPATVVKQQGVQEAFEIMAKMSPDTDSSPWQDSSSL